MRINHNCFYLQLKVTTIYAFFLNLFCEFKLSFSFTTQKCQHQSFKFVSKTLKTFSSGQGPKINPIKSKISFCQYFRHYFLNDNLLSA